MTLRDALTHIEQAPLDGGVVAGLCVRPGTGRRRELEQAHLSPEEGVAGDRWHEQPALEKQVTLMSVRAIEAIAGGRERWSLAGDQVFVDLDLGEENLPVGTRFRLGDAELEITPHPHLGCAKFAERFGAEALRFVCDKQLRAQRLRGVYARVVRAGHVRVGERLWKSGVLYHLLDPQDWSPGYRPASLGNQGFIHLCRGEQLEGVWERWFGRRPGLSALVLDPARFEAPLREEGGFPHLYGALNGEAVVRVVSLARLA